MADRIQQRRDSAARWAQYNPVLLEGEVGYVTDDPNQYKIGDGVHAWNDLPLRGFDGTLVHTLGTSETAAMSQKGITQSLQTENFYRFFSLREGAPDFDPVNLEFWGAVVDVRVKNVTDESWVYDVGYYNNMDDNPTYAHKLQFVRMKKDGTTIQTSELISTGWTGEGVSSITASVFGVEIELTINHNLLSERLYTPSNQSSVSLFYGYSYINPRHYHFVPEETLMDYYNNKGKDYPFVWADDTAIALKNKINSLILYSNVRASKKMLDKYDIFVGYIYRADSGEATGYKNSFIVYFVNKETSLYRNVTIYDDRLNLGNTGLIIIDAKVDSPYSDGSCFVKLVIDGQENSAYASEPFVNFAKITNYTVRLNEDCYEYEYEYEGGFLDNSGKDYPIFYDISESERQQVEPTIEKVNRLVLGAKIVRSVDYPNIKAALAFVNRTSTTDGQWDNVLQFFLFDGEDEIGLFSVKNTGIAIGNTGIKTFSFYIAAYKVQINLTLDLSQDTGYPILMNGSSLLYKKVFFEDTCYEPLDANVDGYVSSSVSDSEFFNYEANSGKDYPMEFTEDAPPRDGSGGSTLGLHLNNVLKNIRVFTEDVEKANKWSYELSYINRTADNTGAYPNTFGFTRRNRETKAIDTTHYEKQIDALLNGETDFEYVWEIDGDIVIFTLDCSKAPVGTTLMISNYPLSERPNTYSERQWLSKKQYFYMGKIPKITGIVNPMSILNVSVEGEIVYVAAKISRTTDIIYQFQKCMFNSLFTFYRVGFVENNNTYPNVLNRNSVTWVNVATSDNIGPISIEGAGWCGANHSWKEQGTVHTAKNDSFFIYCDGKQLNDGDNVYTDKLEIRVKNTIYNPLIEPEEEADILSSPLCEEYVVYRVSGNSIYVILNHKFVNEEQVTISNYYGMQSMFSNENKLLTPNGQFQDWSDVVEGSSFTKGNYSKFNRFIENNDTNGTFQSTYLMSYGIGDHSEISDESFIFSKSSGKSYHHLIGSKVYTNGMTHTWAGLYSWFKTPIINDDSLFVYEGSIDGKDIVFIDIKKAFTGKVVLPAKYVLKDFSTIQKDDSVTIGETVDVDGFSVSTETFGTVILEF